MARGTERAAVHYDNDQSQHLGSAVRYGSLASCCKASLLCVPDWGGDEKEDIWTHFFWGTGVLFKGVVFIQWRVQWCSLNCSPVVRAANWESEMEPLCDPRQVP